MQRHLLSALALALVAAGSLHAADAPAANDFRVLSQLKMGGPGGWDYLNFDAQRRHLFVTRGDRVEVVDVDQNKAIGTITGTAGVHGVAINQAMHRGYTSNGQNASVTVFDLDTLKTVATVTGTGEKPDAILYDPASKHVFTFNGKGHSFSVIDPATNQVVTTVALAGKPEFAATDEAGHVYVNIEDRAELVKIDTQANKVLASWSLGTCQSPSGLAIDNQHHRLFSVCDNQQMAVVDAGSGKVVASVAIGEGPDAVVYDPGTAMVFSSNGESGNITAVHQDDADHYRVAQTIPTQPSARTLALDPKLHRLYLSAAKIATPATEGHHPTMAPDSFTVLTVGRP
ncbi:YncE family protein [Dyella solisilvae]|uniref:YncE family protein n=1 Tax=Dyella solisilvae TaxID=1920168 RepID=A0A370KBU7_9GAMM|nr:YncE family protein [Dyella solisilvae]RDJ00127.1 YncE family protein [Dyella solisilvae]